MGLQALHRWCKIKANQRRAEAEKAAKEAEAQVMMMEMFRTMASDLLNEEVEKAAAEAPRVH